MWQGRVIVAMALVATLAGVAGCRRDPDTAKRQYLDSGNAYFERRQYAEAIVEYRNAVKVDPRFGEARARLAAAYERVQDTPNALREYGRATELLPARIDLQLAAGRLLLGAGRYEDARMRAQQILTRERGHVDGLILLGNALAGMQDIDGAIARIEQGLRHEPGESRFYSALGELRLARGDRSRAEQAFKRAVDMAPASVDARLALANFWWMANQGDGAERTLIEALRIEPRHAGANRAMAVFCLATGRTSEAQSYLETAAAVARDAASSLALADYYAKTGQRDRAVPILAAVASAPGVSIDAKAQVAAIEHEMGRPGARRLVDDLIARAPGAVAPLLVKARMLVADGKPDEAKRIAAGAAAKDPRSIEARLVLGRMSAARGQYVEAMQSYDEVLALDPSNLAAQLALARVHLAMGRARDSVPYSDRALATEPRSPDAHLVLAEVLIANGDFERAQRELDSLAARYPEVAAVHVQIGSLALARRRPDLARKAFERALALDSSSLPALTGMVSVDLNEKRASEARARIEARLAQSPRDVQTLMLAASAYGALGDLDASERALQRVLRIDVNHLPAYAMLARTYLSQRRLDAARGRYEEIARRDPRPVAAETMIGVILQAQGRPGEAQKHFGRALELDARAAVAANNLAWLHAERGSDLDLALRLAQVAREELPSRPEVNDTLGWVYVKKGLPDLAIGPLERAVEAAPDHALYRYHLGTAYLKTNQRPKAKRAFQEALRRQADFEGARDARAQLVALTEEGGRRQAAGVRR